jgi:Ca2+:H+ antiporter
MGVLSKKERFTSILALAATVITGILVSIHSNAVVVFIVSAVALAMLAALVSHANEHLGGRFGPGATGVIQSALGNLPELLIGIFSLRAGLITVIQSALIGSILANNLLVLGLAFLVGGLRNGTQRFVSEPPRTMASLMMLAVAALLVPTLARTIHTPASAHAESLSVACALILLVVFAASIPFSLRDDPSLEMQPEAPEERGSAWPLWLTITLLSAAAVGAACVSDWFVDALKPAIQVLHLSEAFTGLVIVAIAGNAVENVVGIQLAARNKPDYALSVILNSALQVALFLTPALVLLSFVLGGAHLTLVLPPMLVAALAIAAIISAMTIYDGESIWLEGVALIGLYGIIAASFWWG